MTARDRVRGLLAGAVAGIAGGLFGVGGGLVLIPMLTGFFGLTQHEAHGTSLAVIGFTAIAALVVYGAAAHVHWGTAALVAIGSMLSARYGARLAARTSPGGLKRAFAVFLVLVAARLLWQTTSATPVAEFPLALTLGFDLVLGVAVGLLSGYMGVGGGILAVPAFTLVLGMTQQVAQGTSLAVILVTGPIGAYEHSRHGNVVWRLVPMLAVGAAIGAPLASWLAQKLPHLVLARSFAVFLLANAVNLWLGAGRAARSRETKLAG